MTDFHDFKGRAKRLDDIDLPRIGQRIGVGEDELHAFMEVEAAGSGFDGQGRPKMLFEPHVFYRNLNPSTRATAVALGLAYPKWKRGYPADSYPRLKEAIKLNETAALLASSWGATQILGENYRAAGYETPQAMVLDFMDDEEHHIEAMVAFIVSKHIDDEMRLLARLTRPTVASDCIAIVRVYNGEGYRENDYHTKFAVAHNKWRRIRDTPYPPPGVVQAIFPSTSSPSHFPDDPGPLPDPIPVNQPFPPDAVPTTPVLRPAPPPWWQAILTAIINLLFGRK